MLKKCVSRAVVLLMILCLTVGAFACSGERIDVEGSGFTVELGENFELPQATASNGSEVVASVIAPDGSEVAVSYGMFYAAAVGEYRVTFRTADSSLEKEITVTCQDTQGPRITVNNVPSSVNEGAQLVLPSFSANDLSGIRERSVSLYEEDGKEPVAEGVNQSVTAVGCEYYSMVFTAVDNYGNPSEVTKRIDVNSLYAPVEGFGNATLEVNFVEEGYPTEGAAAEKVTGAVAKFTFAGGDGSKTAATEIALEETEYTDGKFFAVTMYVPESTGKLLILPNGESQPVRTLIAGEFPAGEWFTLELPFSEIDPEKGNLSGFALGAEGTGETAFYIASVAARDKLDNFTVVGYGDTYAYSVHYTYDNYPAPNESDGLGSDLEGVYTYDCNYSEAGLYEAAFRYELDEMMDYSYYDYIRLLLYVPEEAYYISYGQASGVLTPSIDPSEASKAKRNVWYYEYIPIRDFIAHGNSVSWFAMFFGARVPDGGLTAVYIGEIEYVHVPLYEQEITSITGGSTEQSVYEAGSQVTITPDLSAVPEGMKLGHWLINGEKVVGNTFFMPNEDTVIEAVYIEEDNFHNQIGKVSTVEFGDASQITYEWVTEGLPEGYEGAGAEKFFATYAPLPTFSYSGITIDLGESHVYDEDKAIIMRAYVPEPYTDLAYMSYYVGDLYNYGWGDAKTGHCKRMAFHGRWADYVIPFNQISAGLDVDTLFLYFAFKGETVVYIDSLRVVTLEEHDVTVAGGSADIASAKYGATVTVTLGEVPAGKVFRYWTLNGERISGNTFEMPNDTARVEAVYKDYYPDDFADSLTQGSAWPLNGMPAVDFITNANLPDSTDGSTANENGAVEIDGPWATVTYAFDAPVTVTADNYLRLRFYQDKDNFLVYLGNIGATATEFTHQIGYAVHGADIEALEYNVWTDYYFPLTDFADLGEEFAGFIIGSCNVLYLDEIEVLDSISAGTVTVTGGSADVSFAKAGQIVTLTREAPPADHVFDYWTVNGVKIKGDSFRMPNCDVEVKAVYKLYYPDDFSAAFTQGSAWPGNGMPVVSYVKSDSLPASNNGSTANGGGAVKLDGGWMSAQYTLKQVVTVEEASYLRLRVYQDKDNLLIFLGCIGTTDATFTYQIGYQIHNATLVAEVYNAWVDYYLPLIDFVAVGSEFQGFVIGSCGVLYVDEIEIVTMQAHEVTVTGGSANVASARVNAVVTLTPAPAPENKVFDYWTVNGVRITGNTFRMPDEAVTVAAVYKDFFADDLSVRMAPDGALSDTFKVAYVRGDQLPVATDGSTANDGGAVRIEGAGKDVDYRFEEPVTVSAGKSLKIRFYQPAATVIVYLKKFGVAASWDCLIGQEIHGATIVADTYDAWVEYTIPLTMFGADGAEIAGIRISSSSVVYVDEISIA